MDQPEPQEETYKAVAQKLFDADAIFISAGAGMGVGSGLGTFRGQAAGVWPPLVSFILSGTFLISSRRSLVSGFRT